MGARGASENDLLELNEAASLLGVHPYILQRLAGAGIKHFLVTPVGFMADHVEVLYDLDIEAQEIARKAGIHLVRSESLNASPDFTDGLAKFLFERTAARDYEPV